MARNHTGDLKIVADVVADIEMGDEWADRTAPGNAGSITVADLHAVIGRLAREVRILSVVVAILAVVNVAGWWAR